MPLLAGPGAIVSVILAVQNADGVGAQVSVWAAIVAIHVVLWLVMRYSLLIIRVIKDGGVVLVTRLAGMMLSAIAVQQIINGVTQVVQAAEASTPCDTAAPPYGAVRTGALRRPSVVYDVTLSASSVGVNAARKCYEAEVSAGRM